jgi:hypothetical protein
MAGMKLIVCNREGGCKSQFGNGEQADIDRFVDKQEYMQNECELKITCSQICSVIEVEIDEIKLDIGESEIVTGVKVSGTTLNGSNLIEVNAVALKNSDGTYSTKLI